MRTVWKLDSSIKKKYSALLVILFIYFFDSKHSQTHIDSVNQLGNSASMCTTKDGCFLALRAKRSAILFFVLGT